MTDPASPAPAPAASPSPWPAFRKRLFRRIERSLAVLGLACILWLPSCDLCRIVSPSMSPTLKGVSVDEGDWVLSEKITYLFRDPRRWEVVGFTMDNGTPVMKRVVGLPGESLAIVEDRIVVNGKLLDLPPSLAFLRYYAFGNTHGSQIQRCGAGCFVLGDDSQDSEDSRYEGPILPSRFRLRPWLVVWPLSRFGFVQP